MKSLSVEYKNVPDIKKEHHQFSSFDNTTIIAPIFQIISGLLSVDNCR